MPIDNKRPWTRNGDEFKPGEYAPTDCIGVLVTCVSLKPDDEGILREYGSTIMVRSLDMVAPIIEDMNTRLGLLDGTFFYQAGVQVVFAHDTLREWS